jgi:hypothetical protein
LDLSDAISRLDRLQPLVFARGHPGQADDFVNIQHHLTGALSHAEDELKKLDGQIHVLQEEEKSAKAWYIDCKLD